MNGQNGFWVVVDVQSGIPISVSLHPDKESADMKEMALRAGMNPEDDEVGVFYVESTTGNTHCTPA
ncbi:MAG: hypothetical protein FJZ96_01705 [Chloroflexi bacterium]|nr:hypothetical protein [Chloroflexota bacterium]